MKRLRWLPIMGLLAGMTLGLWALPAAAEGEVDASLTTGAGSVTVGDAITMTLTVVHPASQQVIVPRLGPAWGDFEVRAQSRTETSAAAGDSHGSRASTRADIVVTLFSPGVYQTPALTVTVSDAGGTTRALLLNPLTVTVTSVLTAEDQALRDLKPQALMTAPPLWPWLLLVAAVAALLFLAGRWLWRRRGRQAALSTSVVDPRPAYQVAYDELDRIAGLALPEQGAYKTHYTLVTDCLRRYLEDQLEVRALDRTTAEIRAGLRESVVVGEPARAMVLLFEESDLVKFAKYAPTCDVAWKALTQVRGVVDRTRPQAEEAQGVAGNGGAPRHQRPVELETIETQRRQDTKAQSVEKDSQGGEG